LNYSKPGKQKEKGNNYLVLNLHKKQKRLSFDSLFV